jgi:hypothetical protein
VVIFGWTIFNETLNPLQISGCSLIILSSVLKTVIASRQSLDEDDKMPHRDMKKSELPV